MADDFLPDSGAEVLAWIAIIFLALAFFIHYPNIPWEAESTLGNFFGDDNPIKINDTLFLPISEAEYLNRQYKELNSRKGDRVGEAAFCLDVRNKKIFVHRAGTIEASETSVKFTTSNCPLDLDGIAHFHPPGSPAILSGPGTSVSSDSNDKKSFLAMPIQLSCVQAGIIPETADKSTNLFRCYSKINVSSEFQDFPEIEVLISE